MSKPKLNALIIGAGGVTSYMLPALKNSFDLEANIIDGDKLEKKNLDRQLFRNNMVEKSRPSIVPQQYGWRIQSQSIDASIQLQTKRRSSYLSIL
jgi:tRNA A37 threonylcarbamoyladenosine dehydratase